MHHTKKFLVTSVLVALSGCGSDSGSNSNAGDPSDPVNVTITALDGYLNKAQIYTGDNCQTYLGDTAETGTLTVDQEKVSAQLCMKTIAGTTVDMTRGVINDEKTLLSLQPGIINPYTHYVAKAVAAGVSHDEALANIKRQFNGISVDETLILSDYLAHQDDVAQAVTVIGETLFDHHDKDLSVLNDVIAGMSLAIEDAVNDSAVDFDPATDKPLVQIDADGNVTVSVPTNKPPVIVGSVEAIEMKLGEALSPINLNELFEDDHTEQLDYSVVIAGLAHTNGLQVDNGILSGTPLQAGEFTISIQAIDADNQTSQALIVSLTIIEEAPNTPPEVNLAKAEAVQSELDATQFYHDVVANVSVDLDGLFTDQETEALTYSIAGQSLSAGVKVSLTSTTLAISGTTADNDQQSVTIVASDGELESQPETFDFQYVQQPENPKPTVDSTVKAALDAWLSELNLTEAQPLQPDTTFSIEGLFKDDDLSAVTIESGQDIFGLSISLADNLLRIQGTPTDSGQGVLILKAVDMNGGFVELRVNVNVKPKPVLPPVANEQVVDAIQDRLSLIESPQIGVSYQQSIDLTGLFTAQDVQMEVSNPIDGLTFSVNNATKLLLISGTPTENNKVGTIAFTIRAKNAGGEVPVNFTLVLRDVEVDGSLTDIGFADPQAYFDNVYFGVAHVKGYDSPYTGYIADYPYCIAVRFQRDGKHQTWWTSNRLCPDTSTDAFARQFTLEGDRIVTKSNGDKETNVFHNAKFAETLAFMTQRYESSNGDVNVDSDTMYTDKSRVTDRIIPADTSSYAFAFPSVTGKAYIEARVTGSMITSDSAQIELAGESELLNCQFIEAYYQPFGITGNYNTGGVSELTITPDSESCTDTSNGVSIRVNYQSANNPSSNGHLYLFKYPKDQNVNDLLPLEHLGTISMNLNIQ